MKKSLHFGMNRVDPAAYGGWPGYLNACWHDAARTAALMATAGYSATGCFDEDCTLERVRLEFANAAAEMVSGDTFLFSNSGHGSQNPGPWLTNNEGLCLYNGILTDSEFRHLLAQFKAGVNVVAILDVCHAGGLDRSISCRRQARVAPLWVTKNLPGERKPDEPVPANAIIMAACQTDESSLDGDLNGAFTGSILETITPTSTWRQWMDATSRYMSSRFSQHPELITVGGAGLDNAPVA